MLSPSALKTFLLPLTALNASSIVQGKQPFDVATKRDIRYAPEWGSHGSLDLFRPLERNGSLPLVVYIHGGGWVSGDKSCCRGFCARLAAGGFLVASINYRLAPKHRHPAALHDIDASIAWLLKEASAIGADIEQVFLAGESAGAHLAALAGCAYVDFSLKDVLRLEAPLDSKSIKGLLLFSGAYNLEEAGKSGFTGMKTYLEAYLGPEGAKSRSLPHSPMSLIPEGLPPAFICSGERDKLHGESLAFIEILRAKGIEHDSFIVGPEAFDAIHCFHLFGRLPSARIALDRAKAFIDAHVSSR